MLHEKNGMSGAGQGTPALSPRAGRSRSVHWERRVRGDKTTPSLAGILSVWAAWAASSPGSSPRPACCQGVPRVPAMPMALRRTRTALPPSSSHPDPASRLQPPGDDVSGRAGADGGAREEGGRRGEERRTATGSLAEDAASVSWPGGFSPQPGSESSSGPGPVHRGTRLCRTIPAPRHVQHGPCATPRAGQLRRPRGLVGAVAVAQAGDAREPMAVACVGGRQSAPDDSAGAEARRRERGCATAPPRPRAQPPSN
jgi:hypothetical protein